VFQGLAIVNELEKVKRIIVFLGDESSASGIQQLQIREGSIVVHSESGLPGSGADELIEVTDDLGTEYAPEPFSSDVRPWEGTTFKPAPPLGASTLLIQGPGDPVEVSPA
jgi:hypothetical protein